jgi:hypothetical protein
MESILTFTSAISIWFILKIVAIVLLSMYLIFALVVVRQVKMMTSTLQIGFEGLAKMFSYVHLIFAVLVLLFAIIIL